MEHFILNILHAAAWVFFIIFLFALIGVYATVHWIVRLIRGAETAVASGVHNAEDFVTRKKH